MHNFQKWINVWNETKELSKLYQLPKTKKINFNESKNIITKYTNTKTFVRNEDSIASGLLLKENINIRRSSLCWW